LGVALKLRSLLIRVGWVGAIIRSLTRWGGEEYSKGGYIRGTTLIGWVLGGKILRTLTE
jgi:hypothetical protein